jgi:fatty acid synthase subunit alpha, fungi type
LRALLTSITIVQGASYIPFIASSLLVMAEGRILASASMGVALSYGPHKYGFKAAEISCTSSGRIDITIFKERRNVAVPLSLHFEYKPSMDSTPIYNECIKQFNWKLWYGNSGVLPKIDIRDKFTAPETIVEASAVETFCPVVGNRGKSFKTVRNCNYYVEDDRFRMRIRDAE